MNRYILTVIACVPVIACLSVAAAVPAWAATVPTMDFSFAPTATSGLPSQTGPTLGTSTAFDFGTGPYEVTVLSPSDTTGAVLGEGISIIPQTVDYVLGSTVPFDLTKEFNGDGNTYIEKTTSLTAIGIGNSLILTFAGTISGGGFVAGTPAETIFSANQAGGPGSTISWSASDFSQVPLPPALPLFATALGGLGLLGWFRKRKPRVNLLGAA